MVVPLLGLVTCIREPAPASRIAQADRLPGILGGGSVARGRASGGRGRRPASPHLLMRTLSALHCRGNPRNIRSMAWKRASQLSQGAVRSVVCT
jgi:hypothetical protein